MLQNARVTAVTVSRVSRENQQGVKLSPLSLTTTTTTTTTTTQIRVKENWITGSTNYCSSNTINHTEGVSHKEAIKHNCKLVGKTHVEGRNGNQQSIESGLA